MFLCLLICFTPTPSRPAEITRTDLVGNWDIEWAGTGVEKWSWLIGDDTQYWEAEGWLPGGGEWTLGKRGRIEFGFRNQAWLMDIEQTANGFKGYGWRMDSPDVKHQFTMRRHVSRRP